MTTDFPHFLTSMAQDFLEWQHIFERIIKDNVYSTYYDYHRIIYLSQKVYTQ